MTASWALLFDKKAAADARTPQRAQASSADRFRLRPMPNEDIHVFVKKIDNTRVVCEQDPKANASAWKTISATCLLALIIIGMIVPVANSYLAGYAVTEMEKENSQLQAQLARLAVREAELTSVEALARAAKNQEYLDPTPESMVVLNEPRSGAVALNRATK